MTALLSRRTFLVGAAALVIAACSSKHDADGAGPPGATTARVVPSSRADASLLALFDDPAAVAAVGRAVAAHRGAPSIAEAVGRLEPLGLTTTGDDRYGVRDPDAFAVAVDRQAVEDLAAGRTQQARGFTLSDTHAALAVLIA